MLYTWLVLPAAGEWIQPAQPTAPEPISHALILMRAATTHTWDRNAASGAHAHPAINDITFITLTVSRERDAERHAHAALQCYPPPQLGPTWSPDMCRCMSDAMAALTGT